MTRTKMLVFIVAAVLLDSAVSLSQIHTPYFWLHALFTFSMACLLTVIYRKTAKFLEQ